MPSATAFTQSTQQCGRYPISKPWDPANGPKLRNVRVRQNCYPTARAPSEALIPSPGSVTMDRVYLEQNIRPIRLAYVLEPTDTKALMKYFELSTCLWGGRYNPILALKRIGADALEPIEATFREFLIGFEPDYFLLDDSIGELPSCLRGKRVIRYKDVVNNERIDAIGYGLDVTDVYDEYFNRTIGTNLATARQLASPFEGPCRALFASTMGSLPQSQALQHVAERFMELAPRRFNAELSSALSVDGLLHPLSIGALGIRVQISESFVAEELMLVDPESALDLIALWNARAFGYPVQPLPKPWDEFCIYNARKLIGQGHVPLRYVPGAFTRTVLSERVETLDSRTVECLRQLELPSENMITVKHRTVLCVSNGSKDSTVVTSRLSAGEANSYAAVREGCIEFQALGPPFQTTTRLHEAPKWINSVRCIDRGLRGDVAGALPADLHELGDTLPESGDVEVWTCSEGFMLPTLWPGTPHRWKVPSAALIMEAWFGQYGAKVQGSAAGYICGRIAKLLGGLLEVRLLANLELLRLLDCLANREHEVVAGSEDKMHPVARTKYASGSDFRRVLSSRHASDITSTARDWELLIAANAIAPGFRIQCNICRQHFWVGLQSVGVTLMCDRCLSSIPFPSSAPPKKWWYRTLGPFSVENFAAGSYSALLAMRFLSQCKAGGITWIPASELTWKAGGRREVDFAMFWSPAPIRGYVAPTLVLAECKSYGEFLDKDIERLRALRTHFPECVVAVCTLKDEFSGAERNRLRELVEIDDLSSSLLVLTSRELCTEQAAPGCWAGHPANSELLGEQFRMLCALRASCRITQALHLNWAPDV